MHEEDSAVAEKLSENAELSSAQRKGAVMPQVLDIRDEARGLVWQLGAGEETTKGRIRRAARSLGLGYGQVKRLWYGERRVIPADLMRRLEQAALSAAQAERARVQARLEELEALLAEGGR